MTWAPQCTDRLRVCQDEEDPFGGVDLEEFPNATRICSDNKLERATVILTGAAWRSSLYNLWIAQILLEEQLQVPVRIENVNGGSTPYWYYNNAELDKLDGRVYSWDALHLASAGSMDCSAGFKAIYGGETPADLQEAGCTENCLPCAHAMLEIWPNGQEANYDEYVLQRKTVENGGRLGAVGEFGWWASRSILDEDPSLASFRGMKSANATAVFRYPLTFGEYCSRTEADWGVIAADDNPFALNASIPSHFCHLFFEYALLAEYQLVYSKKIDAEYHATRSVVIERCATNSNTTYGKLFYDLCSQYWVTPDDLQEALPVAATQLIRQGYDGRKFLYEGTFALDASGSGVLQSTSCPDSPLMPVMPGAEPYMRWQNQGADGYSRFQNRDFDIINSHGIKVQAYNVRSEVREIFEVSARLLQADSPNASPVLLSWSRPDSLFLRHKYTLDDEPWGNYSGPTFELAKVQLPDHPSNATCTPYKRSFANRCSLSAAEEEGDERQCGYEPEIMYKAFAANLQSYAPEAYRFLRRFQISLDQQEHLMASFDYDTIYRQMVAPTRARTIVCDWIRNNTDVWKPWLPPTSLETRCLGELHDPFGLADLETASDTENATCTGHGVCTVSEELLRKHPNAGECVCDQGYVGEDCSGLVDPDLLNVIIGKSFLFWVVFGFQVATLFYITSVRRLIRLHAHDSVVFQTAHPWFLELIVQSAIVGSLGPFAWAGPVTIIHCMLRPVLIACPFAVIQGAIFTKLHRKKLRMAMNTEDLKETLKAIGACLIGLFALWFVVFTPSTAHIRLSDRVWLKYASCEYGSQLSAFEALLLVSCLFLLVTNCRTAYELRLKPTYFNEGHHLLVTSVATFFVAVPSYFAGQVIVSPNESAKFLVNSMTPLATIWTVLYFLVHPKIKVHLYSPEINNFQMGLVHPTGDPSLAVGDPVADMPRILGAAAKRRTQVTPAASRPSVIIAPDADGANAKKRGTLVSGSSQRRLSVMVGSAVTAVRSRAQGASVLRRVSQVMPGAIRNGLARLSEVTPVNRRHQVHLENIQDLNRLQGFPAPEVEVERDPHQMHDPLKRGLAYRSPEMYMVLEKKIQVVLRENAELTKIIEEHRIDPVTGEMDEDFMDALHRIKVEHEERARQIEDELLGEIDQLEADREDERHELSRKRQEAVAKLRQEKLDAVEVLKAQHRFQQHKLMVLEQEAKQMASTLRSTLPPFEIFLATYNFGEYSEGLRAQGLDSTEKLILAGPGDLRHAGMPIGHVRKLQSVLESMRDAAPTVNMPAHARPRAPIALWPESSEDSEARIEAATSSGRRLRKISSRPKPKAKPAWVENFDPASGRKYLIHPLTGESKWDEGLGHSGKRNFMGFVKRGVGGSSKSASGQGSQIDAAVADPSSEALDTHDEVQDGNEALSQRQQGEDEIKDLGVAADVETEILDAEAGAERLVTDAREHGNAGADKQEPDESTKASAQEHSQIQRAESASSISSRGSRGRGKGKKPRLALDCAPIEQVYSSDESDQELIAEAAFSDAQVDKQARSPARSLFRKKA